MYRSVYSKQILIIQRIELKDMTSHRSVEGCNGSDFLLKMCTSKEWKLKLLGIYSMHYVQRQAFV